MDKFWDKVNKTNSCWLWTGSLNSDGYGLKKLNGKLIYAHRLSYEMHKGSIPPDKLVCHSCDIRNCVNPNHLWLGSNRENMLDASKKGKLNGKKNRDYKGELNPHSRLTKNNIEQIRTLNKQGKSRKHIAEQFKISYSYVGMIINNLYWTA